MNIISRQEAKNAGLRFYFTGESCKREHRGKRYVSSGHCAICVSKQAGNYHKNNSEKVNLLSKIWREENLEKIKLLQKKWYERNGEKVKLYSKKYREENLEKVKLRHGKYRKENPDRAAVDRIKRRALKKNALDRAIPNEVFLAIEKRKIDIIEVTGIPHHTDHFIPLSKGGMHTPSNLRIIPATINLRKSNNIWSEEKLQTECLNYYREQNLSLAVIDEVVVNYGAIKA